MPLQYVGGRTVTGNSGTLTLPLTGLTGGIDTEARTGDYVLAVYAAVSSGNLTNTVGDGTWVSPTGLFGNDTRDANLKVAYKIMGVTPDTQVQGSGNTVATNGAVMLCQVWRGVNTTQQNDVLQVGVTGNNSAIPNPGAITPVTLGAVVIAIGCGSGASSATVTAPTGYTNHIQAASDPGNAIIAAMASKEWSGSGAEDPPAWTNWPTSTSDAWCAFTFAIRPAADTTAPTLSAQTVDTPTTDGGTPKVTTDEGNGTIYMVVVPNGDSPSVAQIKAGQNSSGTAALANQNQAVSATGVQTFSAVTGLTSNTAYDVWFVHTDAASNDSTAVKADFTTKPVFNDIRQAIIDGLVSAQNETDGWNVERANIPVTAVVRTSATVVTITLPALPGYDITANETITATVPASALVGGSAIEATPTIGVATAAGAFTLTAESGTIAVTGTAASFRVARRLSAQSGSLSVTGTAANIKRGFKVAANAGGFTITGVAAALRSTRRIVAASGGLTVTGTAAAIRAARRIAALSTSFLITGTQASLEVGGNKILNAESGGVAITGTAAILRATRRLVATGGSVSIAGTAANLKRGYLVTAQAGAFALTGTAATVRAGRRLSAQSGAMTWTGTAAALRAARRIIAQVGEIQIVGSDANFAVGGDKVMTANAGAFSVTGIPAGLRANRRLAGAGGDFSITGVPATVRRTARVLASSGAFLVTGVPAGVAYHHRLSAVSGSFAITGLAAELLRDYAVIAQSGSFLISGVDVVFERTGAAMAFIRLAGSFDPILELAGAFVPDIDSIGSFVPDIELAGSIDTD